jgi:ABC-2 type transport system permease protein
MVNWNSRKLGALLVFANVVVLIILVNMLAGQYFFRIDLTEEKRYSIAEPTKEMLRELEDVVYVEVYLEGDLPSGVKRLQRSIRETLEEFRVYAGRNLQYKFVDPSQAGSTQARNQFYRSLAQKGIQPTNLYDTEDGKRIEKLIFPGAVISFGGRETSVMLLKGKRGVSPDEQLNQSVENVEFELASAIEKLSKLERKRIALIEGHGELDSLEGAGMTSSLLEYYDVFRVDLSEKENLLGYNAIIVAKPRTAFSAQDKYKIDQFIMKGGKALFFIDAMAVDMDSAGMPGGAYAFPYELNLDDMLFKYGARVNKDLVQDMNAGAYPVVTGSFGDQSQIRLLPWPFFPIMNYYGTHPIVKNLDAVYGKFISSIDTVKAEGITKTPLVYTSNYSRDLTMPVRVSLNDMRKDLDPNTFNEGPVPVAYLLEGAFTSIYYNRFLPKNVDSENFTPQGVPSKIMVVADGDFARNDINFENGEPYPLGFDPYMKAEFANRDFLLNALTYMLEEDGIIMAKAKEIKIRPLDKVKVQEGRLKWQIINLVLPVVLLVLYGLGRYYWRKNRYTRF